MMNHTTIKVVITKQKGNYCMRTNNKFFPVIIFKTVLKVLVRLERFY